METVAAVWPAGIALVAAGVLAALLASEISVEVSFKRENHDDTIRLAVTALYGLVRRQVAIPVVKWEGAGVKVKWGMEKGKRAAGAGPGPEAVQAAPMRSTKINKRTVAEGYRKFVLLLRATHELKKWLAATARRVRCLELAWVTRIGLGDAADTAVAAGAVWSVKAPLVGWLTRHVRMQAVPQLNVVPLFHEAHFAMELRGRFRMRLAAALAALVHLAWRALRIRGGLRRWWKVIRDMRARRKRKEERRKKRLQEERQTAG